jgi:hypothetical protein
MVNRTKNKPTDDEFPLLERPKISSTKLVLGCLGVTLLMLVAAVAIPWMISSRQAAAKLNAAIARVKARGEPLTSDGLNDFYALAKGRPDMTDALMKALRICEAAGKSPEAQSLPIVGQGSDPPPRDQLWGQIAAVEKYLAGQQEALTTFHEFAEKNGTARFPVDFAPGIATLLPETQRVREGSRALALEFHVHRHKGEIPQAVDSILAELALANALEQEPTLVSQLVRIAVTNMGIGQTQQLMKETEVPEADLRRLQTQLRKIDSQACLKKALVGERAVSYTTCLNPEHMGEAVGASGITKELVQRQPTRVLDTAKMLELNLQISEGADEGLYQARQSALKAENEIRTLAGSLTGKLYYMYTLLLTPAYTSGINAFARNAAERDSADAAIAAELYRRKNGKWPAKLDDLVPEFLPAVPTDPFTNLPLVLKTNAQACKIYSVGADGVDNSGNLKSDLQPGTDLGFEVTGPK